MSSQPICTIQGFSSINWHTLDTLSTLPTRPVDRVTRLRRLRRTASCIFALLACESRELFSTRHAMTGSIRSVLSVSGACQLTGNTLWMMRIEQELAKLCPCACDVYANYTLTLSLCTTITQAVMMVHTELARLACNDTIISGYSNYCTVFTVLCSIHSNTQAESVFTVFTVIIVRIQYSQ